MYFVDEIYEHTLEVKRSKFITFLLPVEDLDKTLNTLKLKHPKARHFIVAYRCVNSYRQIEEYSTDDGEPKGTSGKPTLNVLRGNDLLETAIIIIRYFGGIKLGTGGLVRAYSSATKEVIACATLLPYTFKEILLLEVTYSMSSRVDHLLENFGIEFSKSFLTDTIEYTLHVTNAQKEKIISMEKKQLFKLKS